MKKLKNIRKENNYTQREVAEYSGVGFSCIRSFEQNDEKIKNAWICNLIKLCKFYNIMVEDLFDIDSLKKEIETKKEQYEKENPQKEKSYKTAYYDLISQWKTRKLISELQAKQLNEKIKKIENSNERENRKNVRALIYPYSPIAQNEIDDTAGRFRRKRYIEDISINEIASILGKHPMLIASYLDRQKNFNTMNALTAVKMCLILNGTVEELFQI